MQLEDYDGEPAYTPPKPVVEPTYVEPKAPPVPSVPVSVRPKPITEPDEEPRVKPKRNPVPSVPASVAPKPDVEAPVKPTDEAPDAVSGADVDTASDEPVATDKADKPKSHLAEWWESTPIGGFITAAAEDLATWKANNPGKTPPADMVEKAKKPPKDEAPAEDTGKPAKPPADKPATPDKPATDTEAKVNPRDHYYEGADRSMGADATEYLTKSQETAKKLAEETAQASSLGAARNALAAAKTAGLSSGEAALGSGAQAGETYGQAYTGEIGRGMDRYAGATGQFLGMAADRSGQDLTARGQDIQKYLGKLDADAAAKAAKDENTLGWVGGAANFIGTLLSDETTKKNIEPTVESILLKIKGTPKVSVVEQVLAKVRPVKFDYKGESDGSKRVGILAQDLEQTPLKEVVKEGPVGKEIDSAQLTGGNTAMIIELAQMLVDMRKELQALKGGR